MNFISKLSISLSCRAVGADLFGNRYFEARKARNGKPARRYVIFKGSVEASKVPADWHGWLHYTDDTPPPSAGYDAYSWQKPHLPNLTGTQYAYRPEGHVLKSGTRPKATGDYEAWTPGD